jgi:hypothetical protein
MVKAAQKVRVKYCGDMPGWSLWIDPGNRNMLLGYNIPGGVMLDEYRFG